MTLFCLRQIGGDQGIVGKAVARHSGLTTKAVEKSGHVSVGSRLTQRLVAVSGFAWSSSSSLL